MNVIRHCMRSTVLFALSGCVGVPEPPSEPEHVNADAAAGAQLAVDGGAWIRPPTGEPYTGPECDPASSHGDLAGTGAPALPSDGGVQPPSAEQPAAAAGGGPAPAMTARPSAAGDIVITEVMSNPESVRDDAGEWFELHNPHAERGFDLTGCAIDDGSAAQRAIAGPLRVEPGAFAVIARSADVGFVPDWTMSLSLGNAADVIALVCDGAVIDEVEYGAGFPLVPGASMSLDPDAIDAAANDAPGVWCAAQVAYGADRGTPGAPNPSCDDADAGSD
jgi:hypothetical protein